MSFKPVRESTTEFYRHPVAAREHNSSRKRTREEEGSQVIARVGMNAVDAHGHSLKKARGGMYSMQTNKSHSQRGERISHVDRNCPVEPAARELPTRTSGTVRGWVPQRIENASKRALPSQARLQNFAKEKPTLLASANNLRTL